MENFVIAVMNDYGYVGIFLLIMLENLFPPIPSELILSFGGFMTTVTDMTAESVVLSATLGSFCGGELLYLMGTFFDGEKLSELAESRLGIIMHLKAENIAKAQRWFCTKGAKAVFFCRFIPVVRSLISIPAGMAGMNFLPFAVYTAAGSAIWNTAIVYAGTLAGTQRDVILQIIDTVSESLLIVLIIAAAVIFIKYLKKKHRYNGKRIIY